MTRRFMQTLACPHCGGEMTLETPFGVWVRNNPNLESGDGVVVNDVDWYWHLFKDDYGREVQYIMMIEVKTHGAGTTDQQRDTLNIFGQFLRNRRNTINKSNKYKQVPVRPDKCYSTMRDADISVRAFGVHLLQFEKTNPIDSAWIKWDGTPIDIDTLEKLFRFDVDPDTFNPMSNRDRHAKQQVEMALIGGKVKR